MLKEIIFFCYGDSANASTWSNVPYMFTRTLQDKDIKVRRVDIAPDRYLNAIYNRTIYRLSKLLYPNNFQTFIRTKLFKYLAERKIKRAVNKYNNADYCIFACFDFVNKYNNIPSLLFSDWTYDIQIARSGREPYAFERRYSVWQRDAINSAETVVSLFPHCAEAMKNAYPDANIHYLGDNVINLMYDGDIDAAVITERKTESDTILFIGGGKYRDGARMLVRAFEILSEENPQLELHIVGMTDGEAGVRGADRIHCYGYLNKSIKSERATYYRLLSEAKVIVNPTPLWAGYSSIVEAMYFYTPVVVSEYEDFKQEFGEGHIDFGEYIEKYTPESLAGAIRRVICNDSYRELCSNAHERVKNYTWDSYIDRLLTLLNTGLWKRNVIY